MIVSEINENGGNVTLDDFKSYSADITDAVEVEVDDDNTVYTHPLPSSGILVPFIMRIMKGKRKVLYDSSCLFIRFVILRLQFGSEHVK